MKVIILAAGQGTRLRPYTDNMPKCMVNVGGKSLLFRQLDTMQNCKISFDDIALVGGYKIDAFNQLKIKVFKNPQYDSTNMVSTLFCAREFISPGEDLIISYGDIIYEEEVLNSLLECEDPICISADKKWERLWRLRMDNPLSDAETFIMDKNFFIQELGKKPESYDQVQAQYIGLIKIRGDQIEKFIDIYDAMDKGAQYDNKDYENMYMTSFIQHFIDIGWNVKACLIENGWLEVDTVEDLEIYNPMFDDGSISEYFQL
jgi:choline kinase